MEGSRLIIPHKPRKHHHRLLLGIALGTLGVVAVWGFQMKMTFSRFAVKQEDKVWQETLDGFAAAANRNKVSQAEEQAEVERLIQEAVQAEQDKNNVLKQVAEGMKAQLESDVAVEEAPTGTVAGESIEAN